METAHVSAKKVWSFGCLCCWHLVSFAYHSWDELAVLKQCSGCVASVMRIAAVVDMIKSRDLTYHILVNGFWRYSCSVWLRQLFFGTIANSSPSFTELICGIVCGCLPVLPRFYGEYAASAVTHLVSQFRTSHNQSNASRTRSNDTSRILSPDQFRKSIPSDQTYLELQDTITH